MRLFHAVLVVVAALVTSSDASQDPADISKITQSSPLLDSPSEVNDATTKRFLRTGEAASNLAGMAERRLVNIDLMLKDAMISAKQATIWKVEFFAWKKMNKTPAQLLEELGVNGNTHPEWEKYVAYLKYYGKGPP